MSDSFTPFTKVSTCVACLVAPALRDCAKCPFNMGYYVKKAHEALLSIPEEEREAYWRTMPGALWDVYVDYLRGAKAEYPSGYDPYKQLQETFQQSCK